MNARGKTVDTTYLSLDMAEERGFIHRDYIAHCLRWTHVMKKLAETKRYATAHLLDVGCGRELPLAKTLYSSRYIPAGYYGVDAGPIKDSAVEHFNSGKFPLKCWENTDVLALASDDFEQAPNIVTMFEVAEHVEPQHLRKMLKHIADLVAKNTLFFISTPCWNRVDCAANHVNEMTFDAFGATLESCGWTVTDIYGTFASIRDYKDALCQWNGGAAKQVFDCLREYYDTNFLSCIFAPLFPHLSRNALWVCKPRHPEDAVSFTFDEAEQPWGSSTKWEELKG